MKRFHPMFLVAAIVAFGMFAGCTQKKTEETKAPATEMQHDATPSTTPADTMTTPPDTMDTGDMGGE